MTMTKPSGLSLYEIPANIDLVFEDLDQLLNDPEETRTPAELYELASQRLAGLALERDVKLLYLARKAKSLKAEAEAVKAEKDRLAAREKATSNQLATLKAFMDSILPYGAKLKDEVSSIYRMSRKRVVINEGQEAFIEHWPDAFVRVTRVPNLSALSEALECDDLADIEAAEEIARFETSSSIVIR